MRRRRRSRRLRAVVPRLPACALVVLSASASSPRTCPNRSQTRAKRWVGKGLMGRTKRTTPMTMSRLLLRPVPTSQAPTLHRRLLVLV